MNPNNHTNTPIPFDQFAAEAIALYDGPHKRPGTLRKVRQVLRELEPFSPTTAHLNPVAISRWMAAHPHRAALTHRNLLATLRALCAYGDFKGYLTNPFLFRRLSCWMPLDELEEAEPFARHRSAEEITKVLHQADVEAATGQWDALRIRAAIYTWAFTGAGLREVLGLRTIDVDHPQRIIVVRSHARRRLKTAARAARLPIATPLADVLGAWCALTGCEWLFPHSRRTGPWLNGGPGRRPLDRVKQLADRAGVPGMTILAFRHSFGTLAEDWGLGELMLQRILRHSRPTTQRHYRHQDDNLLHRAAAKIHFD